MGVWWSLDDMPDTGSSAGEEPAKKKSSRSEMSMRSKIFDRRLECNSVTGAGPSGKDAGPGWGLGCGCERRGDDNVGHDGIAVEGVAGSKVCAFDAGSGSPRSVRARGADGPTGATAGRSFWLYGFRSGSPEMDGEKSCRVGCFRARSR